MRFSIIILSYNNLKYLTECLDSIYEQKYLDYEIIFSDDGSLGIDENYIRINFDKFKNYKIILNKKNIGTVKNFNNAIKESIGEIIVPLAIDDKFFDENTLLNIDNFFKDKKCYIATSKYITFGEIDGKVFPTKKKIKVLKDQKKLYNFILRYYNFVSGCNIYYSRLIFDKIGFFDENYRLIEDRHFILRAIENDIKIEFIDSVLLYYRMNGINSKRINPLREKDHILLMNSYLKKERNLYVRRCLKYSKKTTYASVKKKIFYSFIYFDVAIAKLFKKYFS